MLANSHFGGIWSHQAISLIGVLGCGQNLGLLPNQDKIAIELPNIEQKRKYLVTFGNKTFLFPFPNSFRFAYPPLHKPRKSSITKKPHSRLAHQAKNDGKLPIVISRVSYRRNFTICVSSYHKILRNYVRYWLDQYQCKNIVEN